VGKPILLVEDDPHLRAILQRQLACLGWDAIPAGSWEEARALVGISDWSLVLADGHLPDLAPFECISALRERLVAAATPIVAITGAATADARATALASGADDFLSKPVSQPILADLLARWCGGPPDNIRSTDGLNGSEPHIIPAVGTPNGKPRVLDLSVLTGLVGNDPTVRQRFIRGFVDTAQRTVREMTAASQDQRADQVRALAHRLQSATKTVGGDAATVALREIEAAAAGQRWDQIPALCQSVNSEIDCLIERLQAARNQSERVG
jgi:CheY-like chemotaxis protein